MRPVYVDWIDPDVLPFLPQWHYLHLHDEVLPYAREHGVTGEQIETMLVANPRRFFDTRSWRSGGHPAAGQR